MAAESAARWLPGEFEIVPNGVVDPRARRRRRTASTTIVFIGRHDTRKGLPVLLRAWPEIRRRTGARLRLIGTDPLQYRLLHARMRFDEDGIDVLGIVTNEVRDGRARSARSCSSRRRSAARASGSCSSRRSRPRRRSSPPTSPASPTCATPEAAMLVPPGDEAALADAVVDLLADEAAASRWAAPRARSPRSATPGTTSRARLEAIYERGGRVSVDRRPLAAAGPAAAPARSPSR